MYCLEKLQRELASFFDMDLRELPRVQKLLQAQGYTQIRKGDEIIKLETSLDTPKKSQREQVKQQLQSIKNKDITHKSGIVARLSGTGIDKMLSDKAIQKSIDNGFSLEQHFNAVADIERLFKNSDFSHTEAPKNHSTDIVGIHRYINAQDLQDQNAQALITLKESVENGNRIYSVELEGLAHPSSVDRSPKSKGVENSHHDDAGATKAARLFENPNDIIPQSTTTLSKQAQDHAHQILQGLRKTAQTPLNKLADEVHSTDRGFMLREARYIKQQAQELADNFANLRWQDLRAAMRYAKVPYNEAMFKELKAGIESKEFARFIESRYPTKPTQTSLFDTNTHTLTTPPHKAKSSLESAPQKVDSSTPKTKHEQREQTKAILAPLINKPITNQNDGRVAQISRKNIAKMISDKAVAKSVANGFSEAQHFSAVQEVDTLYQRAVFKETTDDKNGENYLKIHRYITETDTAQAKITLKESEEHGNKIYTLELEELQPPKIQVHSQDIGEQVSKSRKPEPMHPDTPLENADEIIAQDFNDTLQSVMKKFSYDEKKARDLLEWHKDSHHLTKDESGVPKVFYHGSETNKPFEVFLSEKDQTKWGFWFSGSVEAADTYAKARGNQAGKHGYKVFLKAKNIFDFNDEKNLEVLKKIFSKEDYEFMLDYLQKFETDINVFNMLRDTEFDRYKSKAEVFKNELKKLGYDGIKELGDTIVVFDSNQIKHIENRGIESEQGRKFFNDSSPNIYQSSPHAGAGLLGGSAAGIEQDENGNITFDPAKFALGLLGGAGGSIAISKAAGKAKNTLESTQKTQGSKVDTNTTPQNNLTYKTQAAQHIGTLRADLKATLKPYLNKDIVNKETGISAQISTTGLNKIASKAAVDKSVANGFSRDEHFKVAGDLKNLFENATKKTSYADKKHSRDVLSMHRFFAQITINNKRAQAKMTLKESVEHGNRIYSLELEELIPSL